MISSLFIFAAVAGLATATDDLGIPSINMMLGIDGGRGRPGYLPSKRGDFGADGAVSARGMLDTRDDICGILPTCPDFTCCKFLPTVEDESAQYSGRRMH